MAMILSLQVCVEGVETVYRTWDLLKLFLDRKCASPPVVEKSVCPQVSCPPKVKRDCGTTVCVSPSFLDKGKQFRFTQKCTAFCLGADFEISVLRWYVSKCEFLFWRDSLGAVLGGQVSSISLRMCLLAVNCPWTRLLFTWASSELIKGSHCVTVRPER